MKQFILAMVIATAGAVPAAAVTTITQTVDAASLPGLGGGASNLSVNFNAFNIANQYLTSVTLSYSAGFSANFSVTQNGSGANINRSVTLNRGISSSITGNGFSLADSDTVTKTQSVARGATVNFGNFNPINSNTATLLSGFTPFTSGPVVFAFNASTIASLTATPNANGTTAGNPQNGTTFGQFILTYTAVPEPASWMMMIVGFGLVGFGARRRALAIG